MFYPKPGGVTHRSPESGAVGFTCLLDSLFCCPSPPPESPVWRSGEGTDRMHFGETPQETEAQPHLTLSRLHLRTQGCASGQEDLLPVVASNGRIDSAATRASCSDWAQSSPVGARRPALRSGERLREEGVLLLQLRNVSKTRDLPVVFNPVNWKKIYSLTKSHSNLKNIGPQK